MTAEPIQSAEYVAMSQQKMDDPYAVGRAVQKAIQDSTDATDGDVARFFRSLLEQGYRVTRIDGSQREEDGDYALAGTAKCVCGHRACHHNGPIYATLTGSRARGCDDCGCAYFCPSGDRLDESESAACPHGVELTTHQCVRCFQDRNVGGS